MHVCRLLLGELVCTSQGMLPPQKSLAWACWSGPLTVQVSLLIAQDPGSQLAFGFAASFLLQDAPVHRTCTGAS